MNVYAPIGSESYELTHLVNGDEFEILADLDGTPRADDWRPIRVKRVDCDEHKKSLPSDFPWYVSHVLILRKRAIVALRDMLDACGELLPLATDDDVALHAFNACAVDALDEERAVVWKYPDSERIMHVAKPVFIGERIYGIDIFRLPGRAMPTYVSERFVERVKQAGLVGLDFEAVATIS